MAEGIATRSSRGHRTISLPIAEEAYLQTVNDPIAFRRIDRRVLPGDARVVPRELRPRVMN